MLHSSEQTLTFLFTDVVGSTRLWEQHHDAMEIAHIRQSQIIVDAVERHGGQNIRGRGEGDSTFSVFTDPLAAVVAACDFQRALHGEPWPADTPIRVRAALHTGPAQHYAGDYNSAAVNRCARLRSLAVAEQTLLSGYTASLVLDRLPAPLTVRCLGTHRLKDLQQPEQVYQLCHPDLPDDFLPLRSLDTLPTNLPQQLTSFIGREKQMQEIKERLAQTRLLTLCGTGGMGKSRLSLQAGAELLDTFPDGVWLVELAPLSAPSLVLPLIAQTLGVQEEPGQSLLQTLIAYLQPRHLLLILDNCEHLVSACGQLAANLLNSSPRLRILASSRESLNIPGETIYRVPPLELPDLRPGNSPQAALHCEAVRLFMERAVSVHPEFTVDRHCALAVAQICQRLDGIPLAIELAAGRVRSLTVEEINARLDNRFRLLTGGTRTALPRQQTLRAMIDWSYDLLTESEKILLQRLSVFAGGWTLEAAEQICTGQTASGISIADWEMLDLLTALTDKSLVAVETHERSTRYRLLETLREYAAERLRESTECEVVENRHRDYFLALAEKAEANLRGPQQLEWLDRLETEHENLRAALDRSKAQGPSEAALRLGGALYRFWLIHGHLSEGRKQLAAILSQPQTSEPAQARAAALNGAAVLAGTQGDYGAARAMHEQALAIRRESGDRKGISASLSNLGNVAYAQKDYKQARAFFEESLAIDREIGDRQGIAYSLNNLGVVACDQEDYSEARSLLEESLAIHQGFADKRAISSTLGNLGEIAVLQGDYTQARVFLEESLAIDRELGNKPGVAYALNNLGVVACHQGDYDAARSLLAESRGIRQELGDRQGMADCLINLARVAYGQGDAGAAESLFQQSRDIYLGLEDRPGLAHALGGLARAAYLRGDERHARSLLSESLSIQREVATRRSVAHCLEAFASLLAREDRLEEAARLWGSAERLREEIGSPLPPNEREEYDRQVAAARQSLGEEAFSAAWTAGRAMTLEQAIEYALQSPESQ